MIPLISGSRRSAKGSPILALLFALITLMGVWSIFTPEKPALDPEIQVSSMEPQSLTDPSYGEYLIRIGLVTVALIVILIVGGRILQRRGTRLGNADLGIRILGRRYVSQKHFFLKIVVEDRVLLLGAGDQGLQLITELNPLDEEEIPKTESRAAPRFRDMFRNLQQQGVR